MTRAMEKNQPRGDNADTVHHQGLRLALGAFRFSPVTSLYVEADEPSLTLRRGKTFSPICYQTCC